MARTLEQERAAIREEEQRLDERRRRLAEREREARIHALDKAGLLALDPALFDRLVERVKALGPAELERRLAA